MRDEALYQLLRTVEPPPRLLRALGSAPTVAVHDVQMEQLAPGGVSECELRALRCVAHGMTTEQAAVALDLSYETVKGYLRSARYRLQAKTTTHAVALAIRKGLIA